MNSVEPFSLFHHDEAKSSEEAIVDYSVNADDGVARRNLTVMFRLLAWLWEDSNLCVVIKLECKPGKGTSAVLTSHFLDSLVGNWIVLDFLSIWILPVKKRAFNASLKDKLESSHTTTNASLCSDFFKFQRRWRRQGSKDFKSRPSEVDFVGTWLNTEAWQVFQGFFVEIEKSWREFNDFGHLWIEVAKFFLDRLKLATLNFLSLLGFFSPSLPIRLEFCLKFGNLGVKLL